MATLKVYGRRGLERYFASFGGAVSPTMPLAEARKDVKWLLGFVALDPNRLSPAAREELNGQVWEFILDQKPRDRVDLDAAGMQALQRSARSIPTSYFEGKPVSLGNIRDEGHLARAPDGTPQLFMRSCGSAMGLFTWHAVRAIHAAGRLVRMCDNPRCRAPFVATRRQTFCTRLCSDRVRLARFRARHATDETWKAKAWGKRRAAYAKKVKATLGERVKVGRHQKDG